MYCSATLCTVMLICVPSSLECVDLQSEEADRHAGCNIEHGVFCHAPVLSEACVRLDSASPLGR